MMDRTYAERIAAIRLRAERVIGGLEMGPSDPADAMVYEKMNAAGESLVTLPREVIWLCDLATRLLAPSDRSSAEEEQG